MPHNVYSHGKVLITGEYAILDGALGLALPTQLGQHLKLQPSKNSTWTWSSYLLKQQLWQQIQFDSEEITSYKPSNLVDFKQRLLQLLNAIQQLNPSAISNNQGYQVSTQLEFPKDWGLGSSSTLVANLAQCFEVNPYQLLRMSFGGSGYDIACASAKQPIKFQLQKTTPTIQPVSLDDRLTRHFYFIYRNQKQNSREGIKRYRSIEKSDLKENISQLNAITNALVSTDDLHQAELLLLKHEAIIGHLIQQTPIQQELFSDYSHGVVKSLGAWGGDFMLVTAPDLEALSYFKKRGYHIVKPYSEFIL